MNIRKFGLVIIVVLVGTVLLVACSPISKAETPTATTGALSSPSASPPVPPPQTTNSDDGLGVCGIYQNHLYEVCAAYVWNDAHWSLQPYYKYVHSSSPLSFLKDRLARKYHDQALQIVQRRTANWPHGTNTVEGPHITIVTARSSLVCNKAVLTTRENWTVYAPNGAILYQENQQPHTVVLHRIPDERFQYHGYVLHQWAVFAIYSGALNLSVC